MSGIDSFLQIFYQIMCNQNTNDLYTRINKIIKCKVFRLELTVICTQQIKCLGRLAYIIIMRHL